MKNTKFNKTYNKTLAVQILILLFLVILFLISVKPSESRNKNMTKSALLNSKYEISKISVSSKSAGQLDLIQYDSFWGGIFTDKGEPLYFPARKNIVDEFIECSKKIIDLNKVVSSKPSQKEIEKTYRTYALDEENQTALSFFDRSGQCVSKIYFGAMNQSLDQIFIRTDKNTAVFSVDSKIADYLEIKPDFWCEPNLIPEGIFKSSAFSEIQNFSYRTDFTDFVNASEKAYDKFLSLRFSEIVTDAVAVPEEKSLEIRLYDGTGTEYYADFFPARTKNGDCYIFSLKIIPSMLFSKESAEFLKKINYSCSISQWTYSTIIENLKKRQ
ncbi:MAG: DUF4340 domain-containing protein [Treponema sp.]